MYFHTLRFSSSVELGWAFQYLTSSMYVASCLANSEKLEIRFVASAGQAYLFIEQIYLRGGLTWCARSTLGSAGLRRAGGPSAVSV